MTISRFDGALLLGLLACLPACSAKQDFAAHERICRNEARLVIRNQALWRDWLSSAQKFANKRYKGHGSPAPLYGTEPVPGYDLAFGPKLTAGREKLESRLHGNDVHLTYAGRPVATFIDFVVPIRGAESDTEMSCFISFPELYFGHCP